MSDGKPPRQRLGTLASGVGKSEDGVRLGKLCSSQCMHGNAELANPRMSKISRNAWIFLFARNLYTSARHASLNFKTCRESKRRWR